MSRMHSFLEFYLGAEKLKSTLRASWTSHPERRESTAEHSWSACLLAMTVFEKLTVPLNRERVLKMIILHDLAEAMTGDIPLSEQLGSFSHEDKHQAERDAMKQLLAPLDAETQADFFALWNEVELGETLEAKFVRAIDYLEACMQYWVMDITQWTDDDFKVAVYFRDDRYTFDTFMQELKAFVDEQTVQKMIAGGKQDLLPPEVWEKYQSLRNGATS